MTPELREKWLLERRKGIGGSDAGVICGLSPWKSPYQLYLEKRGEASGPEETEPMRWGTMLEPVIRQRYADVTGRTVQLVPEILQHPKHAWMLGSLDGIAEDRVLEVKTARLPTGWGDPEETPVVIPDVYHAQVQHYMAVTGLVLCDVAVLIGGSDFRIYEVPADAEVQGLIIDQEAEFWQRVQAGEPPEPTTFADVKARFGAASRSASVTATKNIMEEIGLLKRVKESMGALKATEEQAKAEIMKFLAEKDTLVALDGTVLVTWKKSKDSTKFDADAFKREHPGLYAQYSKPTAGSRRFLTK